MTYTWHDIEGRMVELCDECGFDARELAGGEDEAARLDAAYAPSALTYAAPSPSSRQRVGWSLLGRVRQIC